MSRSLAHITLFCLLFLAILQVQGQSITLSEGDRGKSLSREVTFSTLPDPVASIEISNGTSNNLELTLQSKGSGGITGSLTASGIAPAASARAQFTLNAPGNWRRSKDRYVIQIMEGSGATFCTVEVIFNLKSYLLFFGMKASKKLRFNSPTPRALILENYGWEAGKIILPKSTNVRFQPTTSLEVPGLGRNNTFSADVIPIANGSFKETLTLKNAANPSNSITVIVEGNVNGVKVGEPDPKETPPTSAPVVSDEPKSETPTNSPPPKEEEKAVYDSKLTQDLEEPETEDTLEDTSTAYTQTNPLDTVALPTHLEEVYHFSIDTLRFQKKRRSYLAILPLVPIDQGSEPTIREFKAEIRDVQSDTRYVIATTLDPENDRQLILSPTPQQAKAFQKRDFNVTLEGIVNTTLADSPDAIVIDGPSFPGKILPPPPPTEMPVWIWILAGSLIALVLILWLLSLLPVKIKDLEYLKTHPEWSKKSKK